MKAGYTIAWSEGTYLTQQHFQYWDASIHDAQTRLMHLLMPYAYGLLACTWDTEALTQGVCRLKYVRWVCPTGEVMTYDGTHMPVLQCVLDPHASTYIYLQCGNHGCEGLSGYVCTTQQPQYQVEYDELPDTYDSGKKQEVALKRANLILSTSPIPPTGGWSYPIACVKHRVGNHFIWDRDFIPAVMQISSCDGLRDWMDRIMHGVSDKVCSLQKQLERKWDPQAYLEATQWSDVLVELTLIKQHGVAHPHMLYALSSKLIHQAYLLKGTGLQFPPYQHDRLTDIFMWIETTLNEIWAINELPEEDKIILSRLDEHHYSTGHIPLPVIQSCDWYLGVSMESDDLKWVKNFIQQVKLSPSQNLTGILVSALPGIGLQHVQRPPSSVRLRSGYEYFKLKKNDPYWESLVTHQNMTVYLPKPFHTAQLSLDIVKE
ncbi:MAG: type VI secretion system baseplate subunit TssK [Gammaproteobacteria bacterium]